MENFSASHHSCVDFPPRPKALIMRSFNPREILIFPGRLAHSPNILLKQDFKLSFLLFLSIPFLALSLSLSKSD